MVSLDLACTPFAPLPRLSHSYDAIEVKLSCSFSEFDFSSLLLFSYVLIISDWLLDYKTKEFASSVYYFHFEKSNWFHSTAEGTGRSCFWTRYVSELESRSITTAFDH
jgi:hypothetical protein